MLVEPATTSMFCKREYLIGIIILSCLCYITTQQVQIHLWKVFTFTSTSTTTTTWMCCLWSLLFSSLSSIQPPTEITCDLWSTTNLFLHCQCRLHIPTPASDPMHGSLGLQMHHMHLELVLGWTGHDWVCYGQFCVDRVWDWGLDLGPSLPSNSR